MTREQSRRAFQALKIEIHTAAHKAIIAGIQPYEVWLRNSDIDIIKKEVKFLTQEGFIKETSWYVGRNPEMEIAGLKVRVQNQIESSIRVGKTFNAS